MSMKKSNIVLAKARNQLARVRARESRMTDIAIEKGAGIGSSILIAAVETKFPMTLLKVPTKLLIAGGAYLAATMTKGMVSKGLEGAGDAMVHIYAYKAAAQVKAKTPSPFVAGDEEVSGDEDVSGYEEISGDEEVVAGYDEP
jgi:hypothetical protein